MMPQASHNLRSIMYNRFGDPVSDEGPIRFLTEAGYVLLPNFLWRPKPGVGCLKDMTRDEFDCLLFLVQEWDFGTLEGLHS